MKWVDRIFDQGFLFWCIHMHIRKWEYLSTYFFLLSTNAIRKASKEMNIHVNLLHPVSFLPCLIRSQTWQRHSPTYSLPRDLITFKIWPQVGKGAHTAYCLVKGYRRWYQPILPFDFMLIPKSLFSISNDLSEWHRHWLPCTKYLHWVTLTSVQIEPLFGCCGVHSVK